MPSWVFRWLVNTLALLLAAAVLKGVEVDGVLSAIVAAGLLVLVNASVRPVLILLTLPVNLLTLGLFTLVINALMLMLVAWLVPGFIIEGFGAGLAAALLLAMVNAVVSWLAPARWYVYRYR
ncbi:MAG: phage holin family protein [Limnochordales bacterium]|nr:phage holin family protein [Limnochordales bacterium]